MLSVRCYFLESRGIPPFSFRDTRLQKENINIMCVHKITQGTSWAQLTYWPKPSQRKRIYSSDLRVVDLFLCLVMSIGVYLENKRREWGGDFSTDETSIFYRALPDPHNVLYSTSPLKPCLHCAFIAVL